MFYTQACSLSTPTGVQFHCQQAVTCKFFHGEPLRSIEKREGHANWTAKATLVAKPVMTSQIRRLESLLLVITHQLDLHASALVIRINRQLLLVLRLLQCYVSTNSGEVQPCTVFVRVAVVSFRLLF